MGASIPTTFGLSFLVVFVVLALCCRLRRDWLGPRAAKVHDWVAARLSGLTLFAVLLVPAGVVALGALLLTAPSGVQDTDEGFGLLQIAAIVTYPVANLGLFFIHAGVGGGVGTSWDARDLDEGRGAEWLRLAAAVEESDSWGLWFATPTALLVLVLCAVRVVHRSWATGKPFGNLMVWSAALFVVVPVLGRLASVHGTGDVSDSGIAGAVTYDFEGYAGLRPADTLLLPLTGLAVALLVAATYGILDLRALTTRLRQLQRGAAASPPPVSPPPVSPPAASPPPPTHQPPSVRPPSPWPAPTPHVHQPAPPGQPSQHGRPQPPRP